MSSHSRTWLETAALVTILVGCGCARERPPDLVLISLDSVRADRLTFRDANAAPHLSDLARRGTLFDQAVSGTSWTLPAHVQMLSGAPPSLHGVNADDLIIDPKTPLLAELLARKGYRTAGIFTTDYLWGDYGFDRGFERWESAIHEGDLGLEDPSRLSRGIDRRLRGLELQAAGVVNSPTLLTRLRSVLASIPDDDPLFLFLHFYDPHYDYIPPPPWDTRFDPSYRGSITGHDFWYNEAIWDKTKDPPRRIGTRDLEHIIALYRGEIGWTDQNLGEVLGLLEEHGRMENAVIAVTADHGEEFFDHGDRGHRRTLYDEVLRVPMLIVPPAGGPAPVPSSDQQVSLSDLAPTLLDYAGPMAPEVMYGRSLRPLIEGGALEPHPVVSTLYTASKNARGKQRHRLLQSVRTPAEKLIRSVLVTPAGQVRATDVAYFDLERDPAEQHPVLDPTDPRVRAAWQRLEDELARIRKHWEAIEHTEAEALTTDMGDEIHDRLAALGYIDPDSQIREHPSLLLPWGLGPVPPMPLLNNGTSTDPTARATPRGSRDEP